MQLDYKMLLANVRDGVYFTDKNRRITYWNEGAERITGYRADEVVGHRCRDNILVHVDEAGRPLCHVGCPMEATIRDLQLREAKVYLHHKEGHRLPVQVKTIPLKNAEGTVVGGAEFFFDASTDTAMQMRIQELESIALLDTLTRLPNRYHVEQELISRLHEMERMSIGIGLLFMDIDHFKKFNDTFGHDAGDKVLKVVANTLRASVRPFDLVGRWGGEEFVCILRNVVREQLLDISNRIRMLVSQSMVHVDSETLRVTISLGATMAKSAETLEELVKRADALMYQSKSDGRNRVTFG